MEFPYGPGDLLCDRFRITERLGTPGQMAYAVKVHDELTDEALVAKIPHRSGQRDALLAQYRLIRRMDSRQLARAHFYFEHRDSGTDEPILILEYIDGQPLTEWMMNRGPRDRIRAIIETSSALSTLEQIGTDHGDVHTDNILVTADARFVLIDPQAATLGSTRSRSSQRIVPFSDRTGLMQLLEDLFPGDDEAAIASVLMMLNTADPVPFSAIAGQLRGLLRDEHLPGELSGSTRNLAAWHAEDTSRRRAAYRAALDRRQTAFMNLVGVMTPMVEALNLSMPSMTQLWDQSREGELATVGQTRGTFQQRSFACTTEDGDSYHVLMDGTNSFAKPVPDETRPWIFGTGSVSVRSAEGIELLNETLEFAWKDDEPHVFVARGDRHVLYGAKQIERALGILVRARHAVFPKAESLETPTARISGEKSTPSKFVTAQYVPARLISTDVLGGGKEALLQTIQLGLSVRLGSWGIDVPRFLASTRNARVNLLKDIRQQFLELCGQYFEVVHRLDIEVVDLARRIIRVELEARFRGEPDEQNTFEVVVRRPGEYE
jgi:predicted Ser/Thr protein kinase